MQLEIVEMSFGSWLSVGQVYTPSHSIVLQSISISICCIIIVSFHNFIIFLLFHYFIVDILQFCMSGVRFM